MTTLKGSDNKFPLIRVLEDPDPPDLPPSGEVHIKADASTKQLYTVDDTGAESPLTSGGYVPGGTDVPIADGGTGASSASAARSNLSVPSTGDVTAAIAAVELGDLADVDLSSLADGHHLTWDSGLSTWLPSDPGAGSGIVDQGIFTYLDAVEGAAPSTPGAGDVRIYAKSDGRVYSKDDTGTEYGPFDAAGGGGSGFIAAVTGHADIVQYWPLNEAEGATTFNDVIGGTDLAPASAVGTAGGPALDLDAAGGSYGIGRVAAQALTRSAITWPAAWTIMFLAFIIKEGNDMALGGQWNGSAGAMVYLPGGTSVAAYCGASSLSWSPAVGLLRGKHLVAIRHDGTNYQLVWDGVQRATSNFTAPTTTGGGGFYVGTYNTSQAPLLGLMGGVAIFDAALSDGDLAAFAALAGI
jgi:hypothetical protein